MLKAQQQSCTHTQRLPQTLPRASKSKHDKAVMQLYEDCSDTLFMLEGSCSSCHGLQAQLRDQREQQQDHLPYSSQQSPLKRLPKCTNQCKINVSPKPKYYCQGTHEGKTPSLLTGRRTTQRHKSTNNKTVCKSNSSSRNQEGVAEGRGSSSNGRRNHNKHFIFLSSANNKTKTQHPSMEATSCSEERCSRPTSHYFSA